MPEDKSHTLRLTETEMRTIIFALEGAFAFAGKAWMERLNALHHRLTNILHDSDKVKP